MDLKYLVEVVKIGKEEKWVEGPSQGSPIGLDKVQRSAGDGKGNYRQYINVNGKIRKELKDEEKPAHGPKVIYRAGVTGPEGHSLKGVKIDFQITYKPAEGKEKTEQISVKTNDRGWTKDLELDFSKKPGPGGTVKVEASSKDINKMSRHPSSSIASGVAPTKTEANILTLGPYEVWRKVWFQASYMKGIGADGNTYWDLQSVQEHYDPVFVQLEMIEKKEMESYIECINEDQHTDGFPVKLIDDKNLKYEPLLTHLLIVNKISEPSNKRIIIKLNEKGEGSEETGLLLCGAEDGKWLIKEASYTNESMENEGINLDWFEEIKLSRSGSTSKIDVKKANVKGSVNLLVYGANPMNYNAGMARGHDIYVALGQWKNNYPDQRQCRIKVLGTVVHEFGHQLGMVPKGKKFTKEGGPHCTDKNCVMYKEQRDNENRPLDFCDTCKESLIKMNFEKLISVK